jgi:hypothetical protein
MSFSSIRALTGIALLATVQGWAQNTPGMPRLQKQGTATQLIVDGKPFLALSGELANNAATSLDNMKPIWPGINHFRLVHGELFA